MAHVPSAAQAAGLPDSSVPALMEAIAIGVKPDLSSVDGVTPAIEDAAINALLDARVVSYSYIYYATIAVNGLGVIAALCLRDYDHLLNSHVPRQVYTGNQGAAGTSSSDDASSNEKAENEAQLGTVEYLEHPREVESREEKSGQVSKSETNQQ